MITNERLNELLQCDSYQNMTDEEINAVIAHKTAIAETSARTDETINIIESSLQSKLDRDQAFKESVIATLEEMRNQSLNLQVVNYGPQE